MKTSALSRSLMVTAKEWETLAEAASRMRFNDVGSSAVLRDGLLIGIVTERDLARAIADGADPRRATVGDYMTPDPATVGPDAGAAEAAKVMIDGGIRHLPLVDDEGHLIGLVSIRDVLDELIGAAQKL